MAFVIAYRELRSPKTEGVYIVGTEQQLREILERLGRAGCEVTRITPPLRRLGSRKSLPKK